MICPIVGSQYDVEHGNLMTLAWPMMPANAIYDTKFTLYSLAFACRCFSFNAIEATTSLNYDAVLVEREIGQWVLRMQRSDWYLPKSDSARHLPKAKEFARLRMPAPTREWEEQVSSQVVIVS